MQPITIDPIKDNEEYYIWIGFANQTESAFACSTFQITEGVDKVLIAIKGGGRAMRVFPLCNITGIEIEIRKKEDH